MHRPGPVLPSTPARAQSAFGRSLSVACRRGPRGFGLSPPPLWAEQQQNPCARSLALQRSVAPRNFRALDPGGIFWPVTSCGCRVGASSFPYPRPLPQPLFFCTSMWEKRVLEPGLGSCVVRGRTQSSAGNCGAFFG